MAEVDAFCASYFCYSIASIVAVCADSVSLDGLKKKIHRSLFDLLDVLVWVGVLNFCGVEEVVVNNLFTVTY